MEREEIKNLINKYKPHLQCIYDIYSKIGYNKISFFSNIAIRENEFKEFLLNFTILGLLISIEQMKYIFQKISSEKLEQRYNQSYFNFDDFLLSIGYLSIFSTFTQRSRKILPSDIQNCNVNVFNNFIQFLGLKLPFNKLEVENFINDRRALDFKNIINLQKQIRNSQIMKDIKNVDVNFDKSEKNVSNKNSENQKENIVENIEDRKDNNVEDKKEENVENKKDNNVEDKKEENFENKKEENFENKKEDNIENKKMIIQIILK